MPQPFFLELSGVRIHRSNLLKLGVEIYSYNDHVRLLSPEPVGWIQHHQLYSSGGADIVMQSITLIESYCSPTDPVLRIARPLVREGSSRIFPNCTTRSRRDKELARSKVANQTRRQDARARAVDEVSQAAD